METPLAFGACFAPPGHAAPAVGARRDEQEIDGTRHYRLAGAIPAYCWPTSRMCRTRSTA